ncbi:hypothetical protein NLI96_g13196 [Meripilus lineatus]|uniref:F-box domain-containing protein n=1 Tax=Meripilus lineatus TaxID=2056292 RepID=A0AAD5UNG1_9APHY|nr:hypothetical protein NLI96_g13196 [Physisporinus lineatus]
MALLLSKRNAPDYSDFPNKRRCTRALSQLAGTVELAHIPKRKAEELDANDRPFKRAIMSQQAEHLSSLPVTPNPPIFLLPPEIWYSTADYCTTPELQSIGLVCRHLDQVISLSLVKRTGLSLAYEHIMTVDTHNAFYGLQTWRRHPSFKIRGHITFEPSSEDEKFEKEMQLIAGFLNSLPAESEVWHISFWLPQDTPAVCIPSFFELISSLWCEELSIGGLLPPDSLAKYRRIAPSVLPKLTALHITISPLVANSRWLVGLLNSAPIKDLTLESNSTTTVVWRKLLSRLTLPSLDIVRIVGKYPTSALTQFIERHPSISILDVGHEPGKWRISHQPPRLRLPRELYSIHGALDKIHYLLKMRAEGPIPRHLCMTIPPASPCSWNHTSLVRYSCKNWRHPFSATAGYSSW